MRAHCHNIAKIFLLIFIVLPDSNASSQEVNPEDLNNLEEGFESEQSYGMRPANEIIKNDNQVDMDTVTSSESLNTESLPTKLEGPIISKIPQPNQFSGSPPVPGTSRELANSEAPEMYVVEPGDTLFDICDQLLDEPSYWPKLWAINSYIKNPHFIYPGMRLRFYEGDQNSPPYLEVVSEDDILPIDSNSLIEEELITDLSQLLTKSIRPKDTPVIGIDEVESFPELDEAFIRHGSIFHPEKDQVVIPAVIKSEEIDPKAYILGGTAGATLLDKGQDIVVKDPENNINVPTTLSVVRKSKSVYHPSTGNLVGYRYEFVGHITLESIINDENIDGKLLVGRVVFNRLGIRPGDFVTDFMSVRKQVPTNINPQESPELSVVGFDYPGSYLGGRGNFIFLDQTKNKIEPGTAIKLYQDVRKNSLLNAISQHLPSYRKYVAEAYVIESEDATATAYITKSKFEVRIGDSTTSKSSQEDTE